MVQVIGIICAIALGSYVQFTLAMHIIYEDINGRILVNNNRKKVAKTSITIDFESIFLFVRQRIFLVIHVSGLKFLECRCMHIHVIPTSKSIIYSCYQTQRIENLDIVQKEDMQKFQKYKTGGSGIGRIKSKFHIPYKDMTTLIT